MKGNAVKRLPNGYKIRILGNLDNRWSDWLDGWDLSQRNDGTTILTGQVVDQSKLYGLLAKIQNLNLPLISVNPVLPPDTSATREQKPKVCATSERNGVKPGQKHPVTDGKRKP
jgi:hypothetical protein